MTKTTDINLIGLQEEKSTERPNTEEMNHHTRLNMEGVLNTLGGPRVLHRYKPLSRKFTR